MRQDLAQMFAGHVRAKTEQVLTRHLQSEEAVAAILKEIRVEATATEKQTEQPWNNGEAGLLWRGMSLIR